MISPLISLQNPEAILFTTVATILLIIFLRRRMHLLLFYGLLTLLNIKTIAGTVIGNIIWNTIGFQRWVLYAGLALLGFITRKKIYTSVYANIFIFHFIFFSMIFISISYSIFPALTFQRGVSMIFLYLATFYGLYNCIDDFGTIYKICRALTMLAIIINIIPWFFIDDIQDMFIKGRYSGLIQSATGQAALNTFLYPIALSIYNISKKKRDLLVILFLLWVIFISYTRTAFIVIIIITVFYYLQYHRKIRYGIMAFTVLLLTLMLLSFSFIGIWLPDRLVRLDTLSVLGGRTVAWDFISSSIISKRPLFGYGFGVEDQLFRLFRYTPKEHSGLYFHNSFLGFTAQLGIPFAVYYFAGLFLFLLFCIKNSLDIDDRNIRILAIGFSSVVLVGIIYCFAESYLFSAGNPLNFIYYIVCAMFLKLVALKKVVTKKE